MGAIQVTGKDSEKLLQKVIPRDLSEMKDGKMHLGLMCNEAGKMLDDLVVYKFGEEKFWTVVNAGLYESNLDWIKRHAQGMEVEITSMREQTAKLDLQGPLAEKALQKIAEGNLAEMKFYNFSEMKIAGIDCVVSRSGYTGEDGFELYFGQGNAKLLWEKLIDAGKEFGVIPCGLAARDSLRLEAGMLLSGQDFDEKRTPLESPYAKFVSWDKEFVGKEALEKQRDSGIEEKLVGFELIERGIPRHDCEFLKDGKKVGATTSGSFSPTLKKGIGLGYIGEGLSFVGSEFKVNVRGKPIAAKVVKLPFYRRE
jgi:aminomethyltransferase